MSTPVHIIARIEQAFFDRFTNGQDRRSPAYQQGFRAALYRHFTPREDRQPIEQVIPYRAGTAEWDAWFAGFDHGQLRARMMEDL